MCEGFCLREGESFCLLGAVFDHVEHLLEDGHFPGLGRDADPFSTVHALVDERSGPLGVAPHAQSDVHFVGRFCADSHRGDVERRGLVGRTVAEHVHPGGQLDRMGWIRQDHFLHHVGARVGDEALEQVQLGGPFFEIGVVGWGEGGQISAGLQSPHPGGLGVCQHVQSFLARASDFGS